MEKATHTWLMACRATTLLFMGVLVTTANADTPPAGASPPGDEPGWVWRNYPKVADPAKGVGGVNRRVVSNGHTSIKGSFEEPDISGLKYSPTNKPTFYLGAKGGATTTESGVQWEPDPNAAAGVEAGWSLFHRITVQKPSLGGSWELWVSPKPAKRASAGNLGTTTISYVVRNDGTIISYTNSSGFGYLPLGPVQGSFPMVGGNVDASQVSVRRNLGLTQSGGKTVGSKAENLARVVFDGSKVNNLNFTGGSVSGSTWTAGTRSDSNNHASPDSQGNTDFLLPDSKNYKGPWIIDFTSPKPRDPESGEYATGYDSENVRIDLGTRGPAPAGNKAKRGKPQASK